jgi:hypothetical protein
MESVLRKLGGFPIRPDALYKELETGCLRAVPDNDRASKLFLEFFSKSDEEIAEIGKRTRENFEKYYQWDLSGKQWERIFDTFETPDIRETWGSEPRIHQPAPKLSEEELNSLPTNHLSKWLISEVLGEPHRINTFFEARMARDLLYKSSTGSTGGMYFNESSAAFDGTNTRHEFTFDIAYENMIALCQRRNNWEQRRIDAMKEAGTS